MIPDKLKPGDEVRIVAPARSASDIDERVLDRAKVALESLGLKITFSKNAFSRNQRGCPADDEKVEDLQEAFMDENVRCVLAAIGGFNSNQLLGKINWQFIKDNPKIFGGFSDITVLNHAILAKTGLVTYAMPNFYCFGLPPEANYSLEYFRRCLFADQLPNRYKKMRKRLKGADRFCVRENRNSSLPPWCLVGVDFTHHADMFTVHEILPDVHAKSE